MNDLLNNIKNLREISGAGFLDCKKALEENNNDIDNSIDFLRKKGLAKAIKKSSREAKEGAVGIFKSDLITTIIQINTETDFAAKNETFLNFMELIGNYSLMIDMDDVTIDQFNEMIFEKISIKDRFNDLISKIGENILLSKLIVIKNKEKNMTSTYIHNAYKKNIGKIAVVLKSNVANINEEAKIFGKNLCMHIAASKPLAISIDKLDPKLVEKEKKFQLENLQSTNKPDDILKKILEGKMNKFYSESTFLYQQYILDTEKNIQTVIADFSKINNFEIIDYNIVVLGS